MTGLPTIDSRPENLSDQVYQAIRQAITGKALKPGSIITEAQLAKDLGVSKTPVREAFLRLREIGLLQPLATRGVRVIEPTPESVGQAYEVRKILESAAAGLAAERATPAQQVELADAAQRSLDAARLFDSASFTRWDATFHDVLWRASHNVDLARLADNAYARTSALRAMDAPSEGDSISCAEQHVAIAAAVGRGDAARAAEVMAQHVEDVFGFLTPALRAGE